MASVPHLALASLTCLAACGSARTSAALYPGAPPAFDRAASDPKAVAVADAVLAATGGRERWAAVQQVRWVETIWLDGRIAMTGEQSWDRWNGREYGRLARRDGDLVVMRELYGDQTAVMAARGNSMARLRGDQIKPALAFATQRFNLDTAALCMPALLEAPGTKLTYVGPILDAEHQEREAIKVEFDARDTLRAGTTFQLLVAKDTHRITQLEIVESNGSIGYRVAGWTDVGGIVVPTLEINLANPAEKIAFGRIQIGPPDEALYTPNVGNG